jgi:SAM-dependent methyltransferase
MNEPDTDKTSAHYSAANYIEGVEKTKFNELRKYVSNEMAFVKEIAFPETKTFVDLGAGYGRMLPHISPIAKNVISVELNGEMFAELQARSRKHPNCKAILGDLRDIGTILSNEQVSSPVFLLLQNSIGTLANIKPHELLEDIKAVAEKYQGEFILSLFRSAALKNIGIPMYKTITDIIGEPDMKKTNFGKGTFVSRTGYVSRWWSEDEVLEMKELLGGHLAREEISDMYHLLHFSYLK